MDQSVLITDLVNGTVTTKKTHQNMDVTIKKFRLRIYCIVISLLSVVGIWINKSILITNLVNGTVTTKKTQQNMDANNSKV